MVESSEYDFQFLKIYINQLDYSIAKLWFLEFYPSNEKPSVLKQQIPNHKRSPNTVQSSTKTSQGHGRSGNNNQTLNGSNVMRNLTPDLQSSQLSISSINQQNREVDPAQIHAFLGQNTNANSSRASTSTLKQHHQLNSSVLSKSPLRFSRNNHILQTSTEKRDSSGSHAFNNNNKRNAVNSSNTSASFANLSGLVGSTNINNNNNGKGMISGGGCGIDTQQSMMYQNNNGGEASQSSIITNTQDAVTLKKQQYRGQDADYLLRSKCKALKAENKKLKEILRQNEQILNSKIAESKLDQQQIIAICNLIYPIISGVLGVKNFQNPQTSQPKTFLELVTQLDDLSKQVKKGSIGNLVADYQITKTELGSAKKELEVIRSEKVKYESQIESFKQTLARNEILHKQKIHRLICQVRELKAVKKQVAQYLTIQDNEYQNVTTNSLKNRRGSLMQNPGCNSTRFSTGIGTDQDKTPMPAFVKILAQDELLEEPINQIEEDHYKAHQIYQLQQDNHQSQSQNLQESEPMQSSQTAALLDKKASQRSVSAIIETSKSISGMPDVSSQDVGPKKVQQQAITLSNMKGMQYYQQTVVSFDNSSSQNHTKSSQQQHLQSSQIYQQKEQQSRRRQTELGASVNEAYDQKRDERKSSFSPSILVRRYLPFFK